MRASFSISRRTGTSSPRMGVAARAAVMLLACCGAGLARPLQAQRTHVLNGTVRDQAGAVVPLARVTVDDVYRGRSDSTGRFRVDSLAPGSHRLRVGRLGFMPSITQVEAGDSARLVITLETDVRPLDEIIATRRGSARVSARMQEFELRRTTHIGSGRFVTRAQLEAAHARRLADVIRQLPGGEIVSDAQGQGHYLVSRHASSPHAFMHPPRPCYSQVFIDGSQAYSNAGQMQPQDLDEFGVADLQGVEFYAEPASTPAQFRTMSAGCGTLVLWTREADPKEGR